MHLVFKGGRHASLEESAILEKVQLAPLRRKPGTTRFNLFHAPTQTCGLGRNT